MPNNLSDGSSVMPVAEQQPDKRPVSLDAEVLNRPSQQLKAADVVGKPRVGADLSDQVDSKGTNSIEASEGGSKVKDGQWRHPDVKRVEDAVTLGNGAEIGQSIQSAFINAKGEPGKFRNFGEKLKEDLAKDGINVIPGDKSISVHKKGDPEAVQYSLKGYLELASGKFDADLKAQSYDWTSKIDTDTPPSKVASGFRDRGAEIGKELDSAVTTNNFSSLNKVMARDFAEAYKNGGMDAVRALESKANEATNSDGVAPMVFEENGALRLMSGKQIPENMKEFAAGKSDSDLKAYHIFNHPEFGLVRPIAEGALINLNSLDRYQ